MLIIFENFKNSMQKYTENLIRIGKVKLVKIKIFLFKYYYIDDINYDCLKIII